MPTRDQMEFVMDQLERLDVQIMEEIGRGQHPAMNHTLLDKPRAEGHEIVNGYVRDQIISRVEWDGFTEEQSREIAQRVADKSNPEEWLEGIEPSDGPGAASPAQDDNRMPTAREMSFARTRIAELLSVNYDDIGHPHPPGDIPWAQLDENRKFDVLAEYGAWVGFNEVQMLDVMTEVVDGKPQERWMDVVQPTPGISLTPEIERILTELEESWPRAANDNLASEWGESYADSTPFSAEEWKRDQLSIRDEETNIRMIEMDVNYAREDLRDEPGDMRPPGGPVPAKAAASSLEEHVREITRQDGFGHRDPGRGMDR